MQANATFRSSTLPDENFDRLLSILFCEETAHADEAVAA